jgi:hydrogenase-1 operon protein HyaF/hydrogenase expression/formation protein HypC
VMQGETLVDHLFADLVGREPELPAHLKNMLPKPSE